MELAHLNYILGNLPSRSVNRYPKNTERSIMGNYELAAKRLALPYNRLKDKRGNPYMELLREDGSRLGDLEPVLLPSCPVQTRAICNSKIQSSELLERSGVRVPRSRTYGPDDVDKAFAEAFVDADQVVVKAHSLTLGRGVFLQVDSSTFRDRFAECVEIQRQRGHQPLVLVQEMVTGFEMRATVIEGRLHNVLVRIPAYVTGDGKATVDELIDRKNDERLQCGFFRNKLIRRDANLEAHIAAQGTQLTSTPAEGERVLLSSISNSAYGGETAVVTELVSDAVVETALDATAAIPGLTTAGIDIMVDRFDSDRPVVIEVNSFPHAQLSAYPYYGKSANPLPSYLEAVYAQDKIQHDPGAPLTRSEAEHVASSLAFARRKSELALKSLR